MSLDAARVREIAQKHGFSAAAVSAAAEALERGRGTMAQFSHPDFGGSGQWMSGGMLMVGDMFNHDLKARVSKLFEELAGAGISPETAKVEAEKVSAESESMTGVPPMEFKPFKPFNTDKWWPEDLGQPGSSGGQNDAEYAYFPQHHRLLVRREGQVKTYDTGEHTITGFSQAQGNISDWKFQTASGELALGELKEI